MHFMYDQQSLPAPWSAAFFLVSAGLTPFSSKLILPLVLPFVRFFESNAFAVDVDGRFQESDPFDVAVFFFAFLLQTVFQFLDSLLCLVLCHGVLPPYLIFLSAAYISL